jgi:Flp pilus assembly protein TadD
MFDSFSRSLSALLLLIAIALAGCDGATGRITLEHAVEDEIFGTLPAEKAVEMGKAHYRDGQFGLAELAFRRAVEQDKGNKEAWLGLAASYDRLGRFELANRAYSVLLKLAGRTPTVLNNLGYHYILRGDYVKARAILSEALRQDPENEHIRNNIELVAGMESGRSWVTDVTVDR